MMDIQLVMKSLQHVEAIFFPWSMFINLQSIVETRESDRKQFLGIR
jgi:hypothetical protein